MYKVDCTAVMTHVLAMEPSKVAQPFLKRMSDKQI